MRQLVILVALIGTLLVGVAIGAQQGFSLTGRVNATDQEAQEGYFAIDNQTMIVVKPGSDLHGYMRSKVGQRIRVTIEPEPES
jgi:flagellar hook protein FlgE